ncbi:uncharacterized protein LOC105847102 isoform X3 [Hydra vulgaris]|uniref:uncharacterized protein LOC105847102 isoform X3 n=1 Tax=Hydra vulgaris TaxID=6087 RepID=UPI0032E9FE0D
MQMVDLNESEDINDLEIRFTDAKDLPADILARLSFLLNSPLNGKDFKTLAEKMKKSFQFIHWLEMQKDPTASLLEHWWSDNRSRKVKDLVILLKEIQCFDAVKLLAPYMHYIVSAQPSNMKKSFNLDINEVDLQSNHIKNYNQDPTHYSALIEQATPISNIYVIDNCTNSLNSLALLIAENYSLNPQINISKIWFYALNGSSSESIKDATSKVIKLINYDFNHFENVASIDELENIIYKQLKSVKENGITQNNRNKKTKEEKIENCKLALMFFQNDSIKYKCSYEKLTRLTGVDDKGIELWLAEAKGDVGKIQDIIIDYDLNNIPLMRENHLEDIKRMLSLEISIKQFNEFKSKNNNERANFINVLALHNSASGRCRVSQIYVASMLLKYAVIENDMEIVKVLLGLNADPRINDIIPGISAISYAISEEDFIEEFLKEVVKDKYKLVDRKAQCYSNMSLDLRIIEEYENKDQVMDMLRKLYYFDFEDSDDDSYDDDDDDN